MRRFGYLLAGEGIIAALAGAADLIAAVPAVPCGMVFVILGALIVTDNPPADDPRPGYITDAERRRRHR